MSNHRPDPVTDSALAEIASRQLGVVTREQAARVGWSEARLRRRVQAGRLERLHHGVYGFAGSSPTWERRVLAAVLAAGPGAAGSYETAAAFHAYPHTAARGRAPVVISEPHTADRQRHDLMVHRVRLPAEHVTLVDGVPVTTYERTLIDMTGRLGLSALGRCLDLGLVAGHVELHRLSAMIDDLGPAPGRRVARLRLLVAERGPETEQADSPTEIRMFRVLRRSGLPVPVPQHPVVAGGEKFRFDGAYPDRMIGLEYLGWDPHRSRTAFDRDHRRDRLLSLEGWTIVYFTSASSDAEIERTVERLLAA